MRSSIFVSSAAVALLAAASAWAQQRDEPFASRPKTAKYALPESVETDPNTYDSYQASHYRRAAPEPKPSEPKRRVAPVSHRREVCEDCGRATCDGNCSSTPTRNRAAPAGHAYVSDAYANGYGGSGNNGSCDSCGPCNGDCDPTCGCDSNAYGGYDSYGKRHGHHKHDHGWLADLFCCCHKHGCGPRWTVKAGTVIMERTHPQPAELLVDSLTTEVLLDAGDIAFDWAAGPDVSVIHSLGCCYAIEGRYFSINDWTAEESFVPVGGVAEIVMNPLSIFEAATNVNVTYNSRLYSGEANLRHRANKRVVWLWGFRYLELDEDLQFALEDVGGNSEVNFNTVNRLYGGQIGADIRLYDHGGPFYVETILKAGVFGNDASNSYTLADPIGTEASADSRNQVAFVGEVGLTGVYQCTRHVSLRGGYQCLWAEGVAVASDQPGAIDRSTLSGIQTRGRVFYHGALASIDLIW